MEPAEEAQAQAVGVFEAVRSAVIRESWELSAAKCGVLAKGERIEAARRRWLSATTARLLLPGRGWVSTVAADGRTILSPVRFAVRRPLPVHTDPQLQRKAPSVLLWTGDEFHALSEAGGSVLLKLDPAEHGGLRQGYVAAAGLEELPHTQDQAGGEPEPEPELEPDSELELSSLDESGRWTAIPAAPSALLFSLRWGERWGEGWETVASAGPRPYTAPGPRL